MSKPKPQIPVKCRCGCNQPFFSTKPGRAKYLRGHSPHIWKKRKPPIAVDLTKPLVADMVPETCGHCGQPNIGLERTFDLESPTTLWEYYYHCFLCGWVQFVVTKSVAAEAVHAV